MNNRRKFLIHGAALAATIPILGRPGFAMGKQSPRASDDRRLPDKLVLNFITVAHTDLDQTRSMLADEPKLIRAAWEWAPGDFETAIGGAAHTGSVAIVKYLLEQGAQYSVFTSATLGHLEAVELAVKLVPATVNSVGPHGLTLLDHAIAGGKPAEEVADFLKSQGAKELDKPADLPINEELARFVVGKYKLEKEGRAMNFSIVRDEEQLFVDLDGRPRTRLQFQGNSRFVVEATPAEFIFEGRPSAKDPCQRVLVKQGFPIGFAKRQKDK